MKTLNNNCSTYLGLYSIERYDNYYNVIFEFKKSVPINNYTKEKYRFSMVAFRKQKDTTAQIIYIPTRAKNQSELSNTEWQKPDSAIKYALGSENSSILDADLYYSNKNYRDQNQKYGFIQWKELKYNVSYLFNFGFTDARNGNQYTTGFCSSNYQLCITNKDADLPAQTWTAPILKETLGAFSSEAEEITIPFSLQNSLTNFLIEARVISAYTGLSVLINNKDFIEMPTSVTNKTFSINAKNHLKSQHWDSGVYKIQIRLKKTNTNLYSQWSNWGTIKSLAYEPETSINNTVKGVATLRSQEMSLNPVFTGTYVGPAEEILAKYKFILIENEKIIKDSGWINHNVESDTITENVNTSIVSYCFNQILDPLKEYKTIFQGVTINHYEFQEEYSFSVYQKQYEQEIGLKIIADDEEGCFHIQLDNSIVLGLGKYRLIREDENKKDISILSFYNLQDLKKLLNQDIYTDFCINAYEKYTYKLQLIDITDNIVKEYISSTDSDKQVNYEYSYLLGESIQLKLKFNNSLNNFKYNILQTKQDTLGGKYPVILRNGQAYYAEFPVTGLISMHMDEAHYFIPEMKNNELNTNLTSENIYLEKIFREKVEAFLNNGKPKLFKSPTEGKKIISLMNVSFVPEQKLGRMIYSFSGTAYEVAEDNYQNYIHLGIVKDQSKDNEEYFMYPSQLIHYNLASENNQTETFNLESIKKILNPTGSNYDMVTNEIKNIEYLSVRNFNSNQDNAVGELVIKGQKIKIFPGQTYNIPAELCNDFKSYTITNANYQTHQTSSGGDITLLVSHKLKLQKKIKNIVYIGLLGGNLYNTSNSIYFNQSDMTQNDINLIDLFAEQAKQWHNQHNSWEINENNTGYISETDEFTINGIKYIQIINLNNNNEPAAKVYFNNGDTPMLLIDQIFIEADNNDILTNIKIVPINNNLSVNIMGVAEIEYKIMERSQ